MKGSFHGSLSRVSSLQANHPSVYGKLVKDKYIKVENTLERYLFVDFLVFIYYFLKRLTLDKEEEILSLRLRDFLS